MHDVIENTVDTKAYAEIFFVRLDVDIGCYTAKRVDHQHVDEPDDRSIFALTL